MMRFVCSFQDAPLRDILKENVVKAKYDKPTPIQKWAIPIILSGRDMMACAQTGSGKTVCSLLTNSFCCHLAEFVIVHVPINVFIIDFLVCH